MKLTARLDRSAYPSLGIGQVKVWLRDCYVGGRGAIPEMCWESYFQRDSKGSVESVLPDLWTRTMVELGLSDEGDPYVEFTQFRKAVYDTLWEGPRGMSYPDTVLWYDFETGERGTL